jgi:hypothetical protein
MVKLRPVNEVLAGAGFAHCADRLAKVSHVAEIHQFAGAFSQHAALR